MKSEDIRSLFLDYFATRGHKIIPSAPLIPHGDPTLLFTSAGMVQFKPYFLGEAEPPAPRLASCQKCFRTTDIESVGDGAHLTFFEMLGNFSIGDYFKKEAISWAWEFVTTVFKLPEEKLWITIFYDDDEAYAIWRSLGISPERILRMGEESNFWGPAGDFGPCGPCSEIHYDLGEDKGCHRPSCAPGCECGRYVELWNLVFTEFNQDKNGHRSRLAKPNIDTGMGLERAAAILQGKTTVYETDLFVPLMEEARKLAQKDGDEVALRIAAEHSRGITFLIADGILPSNEGRGYVLRRLIRRAILFGQRAGMERPILSTMSRRVTEKMGPVYPEIKERSELISKVCDIEEERFSRTLESGLEMLDETMAEATGKVIPGKDIFRLYDTYGFPLEMSQEIARSRGFEIDLDGFENELKKQRERARANHKFVLSEEVASSTVENLPKTEFVGYGELDTSTRVTGILSNGKEIDLAGPGEELSLILEKTPFYAEMGGQVGDKGVISSENGEFLVEDTAYLTPQIIAHHGKVIRGIIRRGEKVKAEVDRERRLDIARNHTATHLLQAALRQVIGQHVYQQGSLVAPERLRFDFAHLDPLSQEEIEKVEDLVNNFIRQNLPVIVQEIPYEEAIKEGATALFQEKYSNMVRMIGIGSPPVSLELCGGTHVKATGEISLFLITSETSVGSGIRRIEAVTGRAAEQEVKKARLRLESIAAILEVPLERIEDRAQEMRRELEGLKSRLESLEKEELKRETSSLRDKIESIGDIKFVASLVPTMPVERLREMADALKDELGSGVVALGMLNGSRVNLITAVTSDLVGRGIRADVLVKAAAPIIDGSGGGKATMAQGGGKNVQNLDKAFEALRRFIADR